MNNEFNIQAAMAAGVAFQTHHVVATFQTKNVRKAIQKSLPFSPCEMRCSIHSRGTNAKKMKMGNPQTGHAIVSKTLLMRAMRIFFTFRGKGRKIGDA